MGYKFKPKTLKFLEENLVGNFLDIGLSDDFLDLTPKHKKTKNEQVGLQTKKLLHTKRNNQQNETAIYAMGER